MSTKRKSLLNSVYRPPYGYSVDQEGHLHPIEEDLELLEEVATLIEERALSIRDSALYLTMKGSRSISYEGLRKRLKQPIRIVDVEL